MITEEHIRTLAQQRIDELSPDIFIVAIAISASNNIRVELDKTSGGISINECVSVSRNIEHNLDRDQEDFQLEVSSAGMDQPFRVEKQFLKNIGKPVKVVYQKYGSIEGTLQTYDGNTITIASEETKKIEGTKKKQKITVEHTIELDNIKEVKRVITFK